MARRSDHTRDEIKAMAIAAGRDLIAEAGFAGFSTRKVAGRIGYTVGTLYNVFENYDDIVLHINAVTLDDLLAWLERRLGEEVLSGDPSGAPDRTLDELKALAASYIDYARENRNCWSALYEHSLASGAELPGWYCDKIDALFDFVELRLRPLLGGDAGPSRRAARVLWAGIHGICALTLSNKLRLAGVESVGDLTDSLIENYVAGFSGGRQP